METRSSRKKSSKKPEVSSEKGGTDSDAPPTETTRSVIRPTSSKDNTIPVINALPGHSKDPDYVTIDSSVAGSNTGVDMSGLDDQLVFKVIELFPDAQPQYIINICGGKKWDDLDNVTTVILSDPDYPKRPKHKPSVPNEIDTEDQFQIVKALLPDADPNYIRMQCERYADDSDGLKEFVNRDRETKNYPTLKENRRKQQLSAQQRDYTTRFNVENFINLFPEPEKIFEDPDRSIKLDSRSMNYASVFFRNRYNNISVKNIQKVLTENNFKSLICDKVLSSCVEQNATMKTKRKPVRLPTNCDNIPLLQELAYITHRDEIMEHLRQKQARDKEERRKTIADNNMQTCPCCCDDEVMPKDIFRCPNGCGFCRECIIRSCEVAFGEGKTDFLCLAACPTEFSVQTLQSVLPPKMFSKWAQKKAVAEIKAAGIEELESCPFCDFAYIPNESDKIFRCLNPDCMKESCRKCKEPNHLPLKCEEVEKDENVKARTYIENKMTEALLRKCWHCGINFIKDEGCNKMTCPCGASMCYLCREPVTDYSHFKWMSNDKYELCPLFSEDKKTNSRILKRLQ